MFDGELVVCSYLFVLKMICWMYLQLADEVDDRFIRFKPQLTAGDGLAEFCDKVEAELQPLRIPEWGEMSAGRYPVKHSAE